MNVEKVVNSTMACANLGAVTSKRLRESDMDGKLPMDIHYRAVNLTSMDVAMRVRRSPGLSKLLAVAFSFGRFAS